MWTAVVLYTHCSVQSASVHAFHSLPRWYSKIACVHEAAIVHRVQSPGKWRYIVQVSRMDVQSNRDHCYCIQHGTLCATLVYIVWHTRNVAGITIGWLYVYIICSACVIPPGMCIVSLYQISTHAWAEFWTWECYISPSKYRCGVSLPGKV